ncbi:MAG TPA: ABC transporter ATP-binding protein [Acidimicrobiia bacterium]|jgi:putative ABC transport system ATP-binding protein|nr:ABC transporter ATP-binding protein [Acidimicrobiia bacterium]
MTATDTNDSMLLHASGVTKSYPSRPEPVVALDGIDLDVAAGEFLAVTGPSGSGKTTLLNCLSGIDTIDTGAVVLDGVDLAGLDDTARTDLRGSTMGFVFQAPNLLPVFSALENVALPLVLTGTSPGDARARASDVLERVGVGHRRDQKPGEMSGGEQQRVALARAFVKRPRVVWADEPTGNLDSKSAEVVMALLRELHGDGATVVLVTHDLGLAERSDRRIEMRDGRVVDEQRG